MATPAKWIRLLTALVLLACLARAGAASPAASTELTRTYSGHITTTDFPAEFPMGAPVSLVLTVDPDLQVLVSAIARFNGFEYRAAGPRPLSHVGSSASFSLYYSSSTDVLGPTVGGFVPWIVTVFLKHQLGPPFSADPFLEAQPFVFSNQYAGAIGATGLALGPPLSAVPPLVDLNGDGSGDAFLYNPVNGGWSRQISQAGSGFAEQSQGSWLSEWSVVPANFNGDALTDFFLSNATTGQWSKMLNGGTGFTTESSGVWWPGWQKFVLDLDGDAISDLFLHDPNSGQWYKSIATPSGFTYATGWWMPGWEITLVNLNGDAFGDLFLIDRSTGQWFWAVGEAGSGFTYPQTGHWAADWSLTPGDFNGDGLGDLFLYRADAGDYYVALNSGAGFTYAAGFWAAGWTPKVGDFNGDGKDDLFLYSGTTGQWFEMISLGTGSFTVGGNQHWTLGWQLHPTDLNGDGRSDVLLYNPLTGTWYQARNLVTGSFSYSNGTWAPGLKVVAR